MTTQQELRPTTGLAGLLGRVRAEIQTNRRAAIGVLAVVCIVAAYGLMILSDQIAASRERFIAASHHLERVEASGQDKSWLSRAAASRQLRKALEERLWKGDSEGIVLADLQDWVTKQARSAGLTKTQVNLEVAKPAGLPGDFRQVSATITALDTGPSLVSFLDLIQREPRLLVVDHLQVRERPVPSMEMKLFAYAVVKASEPPAK